MSKEPPRIWHPPKAQRPRPQKPPPVYAWHGPKRAEPHSPEAALLPPTPDGVSDTPSG
jgi:hypothetical protein